MLQVRQEKKKKKKEEGEETFSLSSKRRGHQLAEDGATDQGGSDVVEVAFGSKSSQSKRENDGRSSREKGRRCTSPAKA